METASLGLALLFGLRGWGLTQMDRLTEPRERPRRLLLVVDDDPGILDMLEESLTHEGHEVLRATSGEEALRVIATRPPQAAIVDLVLPGMDGVKLIQCLTLPPTAIILVTGYGTHPRLDAARRLGIRTILKKPFSLDRMLEAVAKL